MGGCIKGQGAARGFEMPQIRIVYCVFQIASVGVVKIDIKMCILGLHDRQVGAWCAFAGFC